MHECFLSYCVHNSVLSAPIGTSLAQINPLFDVHPTDLCPIASKDPCEVSS